MTTSFIVEHGLSGVRSSVVLAIGFSSCSSWAVGHGLNSCGTRTWPLHDMWDPPGPRIEPMSLALAVGFLTLNHQGIPR